MKTPREILFKRHQAAAPKLDIIRHEVLNAEFVREGRRAAVPKFRVADTATLPLLIWRELVWPCRRIWTGLAAAWVLILAANVSLNEHSPAIAKSEPSSEMMVALKDQQRVLAELLGDRSVPRDSERQKIFSPKPRTEGMEILAT